MKKILPTLFIALFAASGCHAGVLDSVFGLFDKSKKKYYIQMCNTELEAKSCNSGCKVVNANQYEKFAINQQEKFIMKTFYEGSQLISQSVLSECKIIDSENWYCGQEGKMSEHSMNNGVYKWLTFCAK